MFKYLLIFIAFATAFKPDVSAQSDTTVVLPMGLWSLLTNPSRSANNTNGTVVNSVNGQRDFVPVLPIFFAPQTWKLQNINNALGKFSNDYLVTPGIGAHKLHLRRLTWNKARKHCVEEGGQLAIINSISEEKILTRILEENKVERVWLGIHDLYEEGDWVTVTGQSLEVTGYDTWSKKYSLNPDNYNNRQHCGSLEPTGMDDIDCATTLPFFCEIPA